MLLLLTSLLAVAQCDMVYQTVTNVVTVGAVATFAAASGNQYSPSHSHGGADTSVAVSTWDSPTTTLVSSASSETASSTASSTDSSSSSTASGDSTLDSYSKAYGLAFSHYTDSGSCKSESQLKANFESMAAFSVIRLYDVDCSLVEYAMKYKQSSQKLFVGIYDPTAVSDAVSKIKSAVKTYGDSDYSHIYAVGLGNEHVNDGKYTASAMLSYLATLKTDLSAIGYTGKVTIVDTFSAIKSNPTLCTDDSVDFAGANAHAYFSGESASNTGSWLESTISELKSVCGKSVLITESGWPTSGNTVGSAVPSKTNQALALKSILNSSVKSQVILFTAWNELWKSDGTYGVEKYWGIAT